MELEAAPVPVYMYKQEPTPTLDHFTYVYLHHHTPYRFAHILYDSDEHSTYDSESGVPAMLHNSCVVSHSLSAPPHPSISARLAPPPLPPPPDPTTPWTSREMQPTPMPA